MPFNFLQAGYFMQRHDSETNYSRFFNWMEILTGLSGFIQRLFIRLVAMGQLGGKNELFFIQS